MRQFFGHVTGAPRVSGTMRGNSSLRFCTLQMTRKPIAGACGEKAEKRTVTTVLWHHLRNSGSAGCPLSEKWRLTFVQLLWVTTAHRSPALNGCSTTRSSLSRLDDGCA